jgi:DNA modification methylase
MLKNELEKVHYVDPKSLIYNTHLGELYEEPKNYLELKENIQSFGIIQPILVMKSKMVVMSGNLRLKVALELNYSLVPVIYCDITDSKLIDLSFSSNVFREKSLMDIYRELNWIESLFSIKKGSRTDLNPRLAEEADAKRKLLTTIPLYKRNQINEAIKHLEYLGTENTKEVLVENLKKIDQGIFSLNKYVKDLKRKAEHHRLKKNVPLVYNIIQEGFAVYNTDSKSIPDDLIKLVSTIVCSPPYRRMRVYGEDPNELGLEETKEEYVANLINHFNECHKSLKDDGSLFVNICEGIEGKGYQGVVQLFVVEMLKTGLWTLNDEIIWGKNNPQYTTGNRFVRSHEYIFHFVKSDNKGFKYNSTIYPFIKDDKSKCVYGIHGDHPKILSFLELRDNTIFTNSANTGSLRKKCLEENLIMEHSATFPLSVPALLILLTTDIGDIVMDIFNGTGVTGEACVKLGRQYIGFEKYATYVQATEVRIKNMAA